MTIEGVSKTGLGIRVNGAWYNRAGKAKFESFSDLNKGDIIETEPQNEKWITYFKIVKRGDGTSTPSNSSSDNGPRSSGNSSGKSHSDPETQEKIARMNASTAAATLLSGESTIDVSEKISLFKALAKKIANFNLTAQFGDEEK